MLLYERYLAYLSSRRTFERALYALAKLLDHAIPISYERNSAEDQLRRRERPPVLAGNRGYHNEDPILRESAPIA